MDPKKQFKGVWIPGEIWEDRNLSWQDKCLLAEIHALSGPDGCYASNAHLANVIGTSEKRMANKLSELRAAGYLITVRFDGRQRWLKVCWDMLVLDENGKAGIPENGKADFPKSGNPDFPENGKAAFPESGNIDNSIDNRFRKKNKPPTPLQGEDSFNPPQKQKKTEGKGARGAAARAAMVFGVLDDMGLDGSSRDLVERWVNYREDAGKPYKTQEGVRMMVNKIRKLSGGSYARAVEIVEESIANEWTGLFELKPKSARNGKDETLEQRFERNAAIVAEVFRDRAARE